MLLAIGVPLFAHRMLRKANRAEPIIISDFGSLRTRRQCFLPFDLASAGVCLFFFDVSCISARRSIALAG